MTPTLTGRWHTRLLLFVVLGLPLTLLYTVLIGWSSRWPPIEPFAFLTVILVTGLTLDVAYIQIQRFRWDNDWPFAFQFLSGIAEFILAFALVRSALLSNIISAEIELMSAIAHFGLVFIPSFLALFGAIQICFINWRFNGGQIGAFDV